MNERADWLAWSLHFFVGLVVGALLGVSLTWRSVIVRAISPAFVLGAAFIGAALASRYGDQLWLGSHRVFPTEAPRQTSASRGASLVVGCVGGVFVLVALARSFGWLA